MMRLFRTLPSTISPREAAEWLSRGELQLVDVREAAEVGRRRPNRRAVLKGR